MIANFVIGLINLIIKALGGIANMALSLLPPSPFMVLDSIEIPFLNYLNWVLPIDFFIMVLGYWVGAIALYYVAQVILRWLKVVS